MKATANFGRRRLAPLIGHFLRRHPGVRITLHLGDSVMNLLRHNLDLALSSSPWGADRCVDFEGA